MSDVRLIELTVRTFRNYRNVVANFLIFQCLTSLNTLPTCTWVVSVDVGTNLPSSTVPPGTSPQVMELKACKMFGLIVFSNNYQRYLPQ
jgi:hypothetical protein